MTKLTREAAWDKGLGERVVILLVELVMGQHVAVCSVGSNSCFFQGLEAGPLVKQEILDLTGEAIFIQYLPRAALGSQPARATKVLNLVVYSFMVRPCWRRRWSW